jgi:hypothetical protein
MSRDRIVASAERILDSGKLTLYNGAPNENSARNQ